MILIMIHTTGVLVQFMAGELYSNLLNWNAAFKKNVCVRNSTFL